MGVKPRRHLFLSCTLTRSSTVSPARSHCTDIQWASAQSARSDSNRCKTWSTAMRVNLSAKHGYMYMWTYSNTLLFCPSLLSLSEFFKGTGNFMISPDHRKENKDTLKSNEKLFVQVQTSSEFGFVVSLLCQYILVITSI